MLKIFNSIARISRIAGHGRDALDTARDRRQGPRIIIIDHKIPTPDQDSGSVRMFMILKSLAKNSRVVFVPMLKTVSDEYERLLERIGVEIVYPDECIDRVKSSNFDMCIISRAEVANRFFGEIKRVKPGIKVIFDTVDINFLRLEREYKLTGDRQIEEYAIYIKKIETQMARCSDMTWCVTPTDKEVLETEVPQSTVRIIPNIHVLKGRGKSFHEREGLLFIGGFEHTPNKDAIHYFMKEIYPVILQSIKNIKFYIIGSHVPDEIKTYDSDDVIVTGHVPDVDPYFNSCRLSVVPLRYGAGMKGKIGQSLSYGLPVITTSIGAEGMRLKHGCEAMVVDDAKEFADSIIDVYHNESVWHHLSDNGYQYLLENFTPEVVEQKIMDAIGEVCNSKST